MDVAHHSGACFLFNGIRRYSFEENNIVEVIGMITVENVSRKYGDFSAVDDISFSISTGEIVGLLGHNGAGKTTIMKMLTGYLEPSAGKISIDGRDVCEDRRRVQENIGYLPENCPLYPEMTVVDYLDYSASLHGVAPEKRSELVTKAITDTALTEKGNHLISTLSRGYRQRTGVAQAILHAPKFLILDEPTNGLDPTQILQMRELIRNLAKHSTVIVSTHILQEVQAVCDRVIIIKNGRKVLDSRIDKLQRDSRLIVKIAGHEEDTATDKIMAIDTIAKVEKYVSVSSAAEGETFALSISADSDRNKTAAAVARKVMDEGWDLHSLGYEARDLESVFAQISAQ